MKNNTQLLDELETLRDENKKLHQQLLAAKDVIDAIRIGKIDALVVAHEKDLKIFTQEKANKVYRTLIEKMHEGAVTLNKSGAILYCNFSFANMVNLPLQKVIGTKFKKYINDSSGEQFDTLFKQGWENPVKEEVNINSNDGKVIPVRMSVNTFSLDNHLVLSMVLTDLTVQKRNQEELRSRSKQLEQKNTELESANRDLTAFAYVSSHDMQEPLRKIQTFVFHILEKESERLSDSGKDYFKRIQNAAQRMRTLIDDLLAFSRLSNTDKKFEPTDLNLLIEEVKAELKEEIQEKHATIEATELCPANVIQFQFRQLLHNLIGNSLKFSNPGKRPHIIIKSKIGKGSQLNKKKLSPRVDYCHISYSDNGIGFDPQYNDRIFEVFQRLHGQEEYKGTGIGLAICVRVVENHHGIITATGELNKGAQFDIYIPAT